MDDSHLIESNPDLYGTPRLAVIRRSAAYRAVAGTWTDPVFVACSGGTDSMALLALAGAARAAGRSGPVIVVHIDHRARAGSACEADLVAVQARRFQLPFISAAVSADPVLTGDHGRESELRDARYEALARLGTALCISTVVTAHTRNDQVETMLLRLLSGAGPVAAAGMRRATVLETRAGPIHVLRPLLDVTREELVDLLQRTGTSAFEDPSNEDTRMRRNALRHNVIPELRRIDPGFEGAVIRSIELARNDAEVVDSLARDRFETCVRVDERSCSISRELLRNEPEAISSRVVRTAIQLFTDGDSREVSRERITAVLRAAEGRTGTVIELPYGLRAIIEKRLVRIVTAADESTANE